MTLKVQEAALTATDAEGYVRRRGTLICVINDLGDKIWEKDVWSQTGWGTGENLPLFGLRRKFWLWRARRIAR